MSAAVIRQPPGISGSSRQATEFGADRAQPFRVTALLAVDGLGDPQLNWAVEADGQPVFHGGDTIFHSSWWLIARRFSPFDAVFLPANGAVVDAPHLQPPSPLRRGFRPEERVPRARRTTRARVATSENGWF